MPTDAVDVQLIVQITDTHVVAAGRTPGNDEEMFVDNNAQLRAVVASIASESPAPVAVLATGDLAADGGDEEYEELAAILAELDVPLLPLPGNHDTREGVRAAFPDAGWIDAEHASWVRTIGAVRVVGLDSTCPGSPGGEFDADREQWLDSVLGEAHDGVTILALHHPPLVTGISWMDQAGFINLDRLAAVVERHAVAGRLDRIVCGHLHRPVVGSCGGVAVQVAPTTIQAVGLSLSSPSKVELAKEPVAYLVHRIEGDALVSHTRFVGEEFASFRPSWARFYED